MRASAVIVGLLAAAFATLYDGRMGWMENAFQLALGLGNRLLRAHWPPGDAAELARLRWAFESGMRLKAVPEGLAMTEHDVNDNVHVMVVRPADQREGESLPLVLHVHGGAFVSGTEYDPVAFIYPRRARVVVVSVRYRLAPESQYPAAVDDCWAALEWAVRGAHFLNVDPARVGVAGTSAGGALAAALSLRAAQVEAGGDVRIHVKAQLLVVPVVAYGASTESGGDFGSIDAGWNAPMAAWAWAKYAPDRRACQKDPQCEPAAATAEDLALLPPTVAVVATLDILRDEGLEYVERLRESGVQTQLLMAAGAHSTALIFNRAVLTDAMDAFLELLV